jgi:hypothetical protein
LRRSALTKPTKLPPNGFVSFVGPHSKRLTENISLSDVKNSPKHESYALRKLTQPPENGFVSFVSVHTDRLGEIYPLSDGNNDSCKNDNITPKCTPNELTKPYSEALHRIEPMTDCLHGKPCKRLDCYPGERPGCLKAMDYVFDLDQCPIGAWGQYYRQLFFWKLMMKNEMSKIKQILI